MPTLEIRVLGPPKVLCSERPIHIPRRQARALLYRLAVQLQPVPREHLSYLFWANESEASARRHLTHLLTHLRRALPGASELFTYGDQIGLNPELVESDTVTFLTFAQDYNSGPGIEVLHTLVNLYREPFLAGFSMPDSPEFEAWTMVERRVWERYYQEALLALVDEYILVEDYQRAIDMAQRYLATNHLDEDMHCRLIKLYAVTGDRGAALRQYQRCADALGRELGITPLKQTKLLYMAALDGKLSAQDLVVEHERRLPFTEHQVLRRQLHCSPFQRQPQRVATRIAAPAV